MKIALTSLLLTAACATVPATLPNGTFSNVTYSDETGDLGGFQMETDFNGSQPMVIFTTCEGGCFGGRSWPASVAGDTISFTVVDEWFSEGAGGAWHKSPTSLMEPRTVHHEATRFTATLSRKGWVLISPDLPEVKATLRLKRGARPGDTANLAAAN